MQQRPAYDADSRSMRSGTGEGANFHHYFLNNRATCPHSATRICLTQSHQVGPIISILVLWFHNRLDLQNTMVHEPSSLTYVLHVQPILYSVMQSTPWTAQFVDSNLQARPRKNFDSRHGVEYFYSSRISRPHWGPHNFLSKVKWPDREAHHIILFSAEDKNTSQRSAYVSRGTSKQRRISRLNVDRVKSYHVAPAAVASSERVPVHYLPSLNNHKMQCCQRFVTNTPQAARVVGVQRAGSVSTPGILSGIYGVPTGFSPNNSGFPCQYHSTNAPC